MDWDQSYYVRLYRSQSPDWLGLPALTRGLFAELLLLADRAGVIPLGRAGLKSIAVPLRDRWEDIEPHVTRLLEDGAIALVDGAVLIPNFTAAQAKPKTSTERSQDHRARNAGDATPAPATPKVRRQRGKTPTDLPATPPVAATSGDGTQRDATEGNGGDGCNDKDKQTNKQTDHPPTPQGDAVGLSETSEAAPSEPTESQLWVAYIQGISAGRGAALNFVRADLETQALQIVWAEFGDAKGVAIPKFLAALKANAQRYVEACRDAKRDPALEGFFKPQRFLAWLRREEAGSAPFPYADRKPEPLPGDRMPVAKALGTTPLPAAPARPTAAALALTQGIGGGGR